MNGKLFRAKAFYDIEVFAKYWLVVFLDDNGWHSWDSENGTRGMLYFVKSHTIIGYNNGHYDDSVLTKIINSNGNTALVKAENDRIINGGKVSRKYVLPEIDSLDMMQQIDVSRPCLKRIEANMGMDIRETEVPFDLPRALTYDERCRTIKYCKSDVKATAAIWKIRESEYITPKMGVVKMLPVDKQPAARYWNTTTITGNVIAGGANTPQWATIMLNPVDKTDLSLLSKVPDEVAEMWLDNWRPVMDKTKGAVKKLVHHEHGVVYEFGFGGLHGIPENPRPEYANIVLLDVASLYPNIMMALNAFGEHTGVYREIVQERLRAKAAGDKTKAAALKLVVNSAYGLTKNQYSNLCNPPLSISVCIYGQIALYDLCRRLYDDGAELVNINTDGVGFVPRGCDWETIRTAWQQEYGFTLEDDHFSRWIQKDVNNYIAVGTDGHIKTKGGDVGRYGKPRYFSNNSLRIIDVAVTDALVKGIPILDTLTEKAATSPDLFQIVLQAGHTCDGTTDAGGNKYQNVNRVFAARDGVTLYKQRPDGGLVHYPDAPEKMLVHNGPVDALDAGELDINWYYKLCNKVLKRWKKD